MESQSQARCPQSYEDMIEDWDGEEILGLIEEKKFFIERRDKNLFDDREYEKTWHFTCDLIQQRIDKEIAHYEQRYNKKFIPNI